ncbi:MAG TPA: hypothetical protein VGQ96_02720, partial [Candidatus Eremiobacteraceae bacterium]|nr:hypothetical protein [Candidatus Eremiobacteraceae bacterium]
MAPATNVNEMEPQEQAKSKQQGVKGEPPTVRKSAAGEKKEGAKPKHAQAVTVGIPLDGLSHVERDVPVDEPPALAPNSELKYIGKPTPRQDGRAKVTGEARYTADVRLPGMLFGRLLDAAVPHDRVLAIDTSAAERYPGVRAVHVIEHVLGNAELRDKSKETPSRYPIVRYAGQPLAGVAAISQDAADEAAALIEVRYETMP